MIDSNDLSRNWYLVYSKASKEQTAYEHLIRQGYEVFFPKAKKTMVGGKEKIEAMFPRYIFIKLSAKNDNWSPIRFTAGVSNLVRFGFNYTPVNSQLVNSLLDKCDGNSIIELPKLKLKVGDSVRVCNGMLKGYEAIVTEKSGRERVEILLMNLKTNARVTVPKACLEYVNS